MPESVYKPKNRYGSNQSYGCQYDGIGLERYSESVKDAFRSRCQRPDGEDTFTGNAERQYEPEKKDEQVDRQQPV